MPRLNSARLNSGMRLYPRALASTDFSFPSTTSPQSPEGSVEIKVRLRLRPRKRRADAVVHAQAQKQVRALQAVYFRCDHCSAARMRFAHEREQRVVHGFGVAKFGDQIRRQAHEVDIQIL